MKQQMNGLRVAIDALVYFSVILGAALIAQAFNLLPRPVAYSIVIGWLVYMVAALLVFRRRVRIAYPLVMMLAVLTLVVTLPQPEHYSLVNPGQALAGATFLLGSATQVCLIVLIPLYFLMKRKTQQV